MSKEYFVYDNDGCIEWFDSLEKANEHAQILIGDCRDDAYRYGEWPDYVESIRVGVALGVSRELRHEDDSCDYKLEKSDFQAGIDRLNADAAELRRERDELARQNAELAARLAEIEAQEPVAKIHADGYWTARRGYDPLPDGKAFLGVYACPVPAQTVPDGWRLVLTEARDLFAAYAEIHRARGPEHAEKAARNEAMATKINAALAAAPEHKA